MPLEIDYTLERTHRRNITAAKELGLSFNKDLNGFADKAGKLVGCGYDESNDRRWGHLSPSDVVNCHR
ncbi:MAG: hypothetical protein JWL87_203 [Candidatus Adlerbacteria bacterium]|nr:hypothetical protein [Candidatus Adlerbacteria bacterium]